MWSYCLYIFNWFCKSFSLIFPTSDSCWFKRENIFSNCFLWTSCSLSFSSSVMSASIFFTIAACLAFLTRAARVPESRPLSSSAPLKNDSICSSDALPEKNVVKIRKKSSRSRPQNDQNTTTYNNVVLKVLLRNIENATSYAKSKNDNLKLMLKWH